MQWFCDSVQCFYGLSQRRDSSHKEFDTRLTRPYFSDPAISPEYETALPANALGIQAWIKIICLRSFLGGLGCQYLIVLWSYNCSCIDAGFACQFLGNLFPFSQPYHRFFLQDSLVKLGRPLYCGREYVSGRCFTRQWVIRWKRSEDLKRYLFSTCLQWNWTLHPPKKARSSEFTPALHFGLPFADSLLFLLLLTFLQLCLAAFEEHSRILEGRFQDSLTFSDVLQQHMPKTSLRSFHDRRKFRSQTSDNMHRWKAEQGRGREKRKIRREKSRRERVRRKKIQMREKVGKLRFTVFFQWFVAPEGRKVGLLRRRVRSQLARWEMKNCTPLWREHFEVKMYKTHQLRTTFGSWDVENARRCGAKHILKSKCTKHTSSGPLLAVEMSKKCTPLWREAHFEVKMYKPPHVRATFGGSDVEKVHAVAARSTFWSQNVQNTPGSDHFWKLRCRKSARRCGAKHILKSKCTKHTSSGPLLAVEMSKKCTPLWREAHFEVKMLKAPGVRTTFRGSAVASLRYTTPHYTTLHSTTLHYTTLHYTPRHYNYNCTTTQLHSTTTTTTQLQLHNYTPLH